MGAEQPTRRKRTAVDLAKEMGCHPRTVRRYVALPRAEYEANAISRAKPWEALGMSRATWYRRGKPVALPAKSVKS